MMCEEVQERMAAFVAHELPQKNADFIKQHMKNCSSCQTWHDEVVAMSDSWNEIDTHILNLDLVTPVMRRLEINLLSHQEYWPANQKKRYLRLPMIASLSHYGLAASLTIALFQLGAFEHLGFSLAHMNVLLAVKVQSFYQFAAHI